MRAICKSEIIAESENTVVVEGNHHSPPDSVNREYLKSSQTTAVCPWKGTAHYYRISVGSEENRDAAWHYPDPKEPAAEIKDHVAFWRGFDVH